MKKYVVVLIALALLYFLYKRKTAAVAAPASRPADTSGTLNSGSIPNGSASVTLQAANLGLQPQIVVQPAAVPLMPVYTDPTEGTGYQPTGAQALTF